MPVAFVPSDVDGLENVVEVRVHPDRIELQQRPGDCTVISFDDIAEWPKPAWLWRRLKPLINRPRCLLVADRDWFHVPQQRYFRFYTSPPITIFMPVEDELLDAPDTTFDAIRDTIHSGSYRTADLG